MMTWNDISVWQFQQINNLMNKKNIKYDENATIDALSILLNLNKKEVLKLNDKNLKIAIKQLEFLFNDNPNFIELDKIKINNSYFNIDYDIANSKAGRYIEIKYFCTDIINNAHKIMASMCIEKKIFNLFKIKKNYIDHNYLSENIQSMPFIGIFGSIYKKIDLIKKFESNYKILFKNDDLNEDEKPHPFIKSFGWIYQAKLVAEHENIKLNEVYEMSTINFLNDLSYIASKAKYEEDLRKKANAKL